MIRRKKAVIVLVAVFLACFVFFGMKANNSLFQVSQTRQNLTAYYQSCLSYIKSELSQTYDQNDETQVKKHEKDVKKLASLQNALDALKTGDLQKRLQAEETYLELEVYTFGSSADGTEKSALAFDQAMLQFGALPCDNAEDGVSSVCAFLKNWLIYLIPLCAMLLDSDLISGEKASGSIKLLLQRRKTRAALYARKYLIGLEWVLAAVLIAMLGAFAGGAIFGAGVGRLGFPISVESGYDPTWRIFLFGLPVVLLSVVFNTALALFLSTLYRKGTLSVAASAAGFTALVFFGRKTVTAMNGNFWQFSPFECGDALTGVLGKLSVPIQASALNPITGQMVTYNTGSTYDIAAALPLWGYILVLAVWSALFLAAGIMIFRRKDLV